MKHIEKVQSTSKAYTTCAVGLLSGLLVVLFAATVFLASTTTALAQPSGEAGPKTQRGDQTRAGRLLDHDAQLRAQRTRL